METVHRIDFGDARDLSHLESGSVDLVVTSPPYPMIEMWDDLFGDLNPAIRRHLAEGDGRGAFDAMHDELDRAWAELERVLRSGGIACVNVGDATRTVDGRFRVYQNHARVVESFDRLGFDPLPEVLWRKPSNAATKFMGSGMLPPNAYPTLEHEYLLPFRKGAPRAFPPGDERRYASAYFWEERNAWFSDLWRDITGTDQTLSTSAHRERSGAFPLEIPYRLINMFSVYGDTVLDPFWGTGTTSIAAMVAGRDSVGVERDAGLFEAFERVLPSLESVSRSMARDRLAAHRAFVRRRRHDGSPPSYAAELYDVPVVTAQERQIALRVVANVERLEDRRFRVRHERFRPIEDEAPREFTG